MNRICRKRSQDLFLSPDGLNESGYYSLFGSMFFLHGFRCEFAESSDEPMSSVDKRHIVQRLTEKYSAETFSKSFYSLTARDGDVSLESSSHWYLLVSLLPRKTGDERRHQFHCVWRKY